LPGKPRIPIIGKRGSREFMQSYLGIAKNPPPKLTLERRPIGKIYYLSDGEHIKIGFTSDWTKRQKAYATHSPRPLQILASHPGTKADEKRLHRMFKEHRARNEWFHQSPEILAHIRTLGELKTA
jgi:hypothetical protein